MLSSANQVFIEVYWYLMMLDMHVKGNHMMTKYKWVKTCQWLKIEGQSNSMLSFKE